MLILWLAGLTIFSIVESMCPTTFSIVKNMHVGVMRRIFRRGCVEESFQAIEQLIDYYNATQSHEGPGEHSTHQLAWIGCHVGCQRSLLWHR